MTLEELEVQVQRNTTAINSLDAALDSYATTTALNSLNTTVNANQAAITALQEAVAALQTSISLVNKLSKLLDTNIGNDLAKDDLLQFDGDRWTNIKPSELGISGGGTGGVSSLEQLQDVSISNKSHGQALTWNATAGKWTNTTINTGGGGGSDFDEDAMWEALGGSSSNKKISPTYINGQELSLTGLTVNGSNIIFTNSTNTVTVSSTNLTVSQGINATGNILSANEITAYA